MLKVFLRFATADADVMGGLRQGAATLEGWKALISLELRLRFALHWGDNKSAVGLSPGSAPPYRLMINCVL